jgi:oligopeptide transport system substrate-binding protein
MVFRVKRTALLGVVLVTLAGVAGCAPTASTPPGMFSYYLGEPQRPLVPGNTTETEGSKIVDAVWTPLVTFDVKSRAVTYDGAAESVTSTDNMHWSIKLKPGWTFHDGTPVTAESYVKAWNYTALSTNAQGASYFFSNIAGYKDLQADEGGKPAATAMSGLSAPDPVTIDVTLVEPFAIFPVSLGYSAFDPLPEVFYKDPVAFGKKPIGQGPFKSEDEWVPGHGMTLTRYDNYAGKDKAKSKGVVMKMYTELSTGYTDVLAGNLDILKNLPPDAYASAKDVFKDRYMEQAAPDITSLGFPLYDRRYADVRVRRALSMAIDRKAIVNAIFLGTRVAADSFAPPTVVGYRANACGKWCEYHPDEAKKLLAEAGFDMSKPVEIWFNAGAGHDGWMTAVANMFRKIGLTYKLRGNLQFNEFLSKRDAKEMTGPFRLAWVMDYPSIENFLAPIFKTGASSNDGDYSNPAFDKLLVDAAASTDAAEANAKYQEAEKLLASDFPAMPMWYGKTTMGWSDKVTGVKITAFGTIDLPSVSLK